VAAAGAVVNVEKPKRFLRGFSKQLVEIIKKKPPQATFIDFHSCGIFHRPSRPPIAFGRRQRSPRFVMGKIRRKFETEFKRQLVAQIESGQLSVRQAAREHQLSSSLIKYWCNQFHNDSLVERPSARERQLEAENEKLKAKVGDLVMQMDHLKKWQAWLQRKKSADTSVITAKNWDQFRKPAK
jgi:transposase-like protein